jgi:thiosulfate/3-mercaptopyruvate sulfurtransferase
MMLSRVAITYSFFGLVSLSAVFVRAQSAAEPWTSAQTVQSADLAKELASGNPAPTVLYVGFQRLYNAGHIKGAQYHGSAGKPEGLAEIKKWADALPRSTNLLIYCGCCPMDKCPNIRPAFTALREMGFTNLCVLVLPTSFAVDWAEKGLPYEKASSSGPSS